jgi:GTPase SAR1 family protein
MPLEHVGWVLPTIEAAYRHREDLDSLWERLISYLLGKRSQIAITGMSGVGKSHLFEYLTGEAYERNHEAPPQPSPMAEKGKIQARKKRILITTIPGQTSFDQRLIDSQKVFEAKRPTVGVIHVTGNGFAKTRQRSVQEELIEKGIETIQQFQTYQKEEEIKDLKSTCEMIKRSHVKHRKRIWMFVAATKCDLYASDLRTVEDYYSPHAQNAFVAELKALQHELGTLTFSWDSIPVCTTLEDFVWNGATVPSTLKPWQRDHLVSALLKRIEQECA